MSRSTTSIHVCPLCGKPLAPEIYHLSTRIAPGFAAGVKMDNPGWKPEAGICPSCAVKAVEAAQQARSRVSIQDEMMLPYPVYARNETDLLPAFEYLDASPHFSGQGVTMAFLDSGFYPHPDLTHPENRILHYVDATGIRAVEKIAYHKPDVSSWHGTMTSCVAAGNGTMSEQRFRGLAYRANLVLVKTGNPQGRGIREADIERALSWVLYNYLRFNIRVINISLGGDYPSNGKLSKLDLMVEEAVERGIVVVTAAGNDGVERLVSPASSPSAITVGGVDTRNSYDRRRWRIYNSNYGSVPGGQRKPELLAPARWLAAPMVPNTRVHNEGLLLWRLAQTVDRLRQSDADMIADAGEGEQTRLDTVHRKISKRMIEQKYIHPHYQHVDGTSMAAPLVSAIAAMMLEANPGLRPAEVKKILMSSAVPLRNFPKEKSGAGMVHAGRALGAARRASRGVLDKLPFSPHPVSELISFYFFDPTNLAARVSLIGSFNEWQPDGFELRTSSQGLWQISIPRLPAGKYYYKFLVDDNWIHDRENPNRAEDGYGGFNSILDVKS